MTVTTPTLGSTANIVYGADELDSFLASSLADREGDNSGQSTHKAGDRLADCSTSGRSTHKTSDRLADCSTSGQSTHKADDRLLDCSTSGRSTHKAGDRLEDCGDDVSPLIWLRRRTTTSASAQQHPFTADAHQSTV